MRIPILSITLLVVTCWASTPAFSQPDSDITEIVVVGNNPGPPLWQVKNGQNTLWIFADLSPLPKKMNWDSSRVERIMENSDEYLRKPVVERSFGLTGIFKTRRIGRLQQERMKISDDGDLSDVLSTELYQKLLAVMNEFNINQSLLKNKPLFSASILWSNIFDQSNITNDSSFVIKELNNLVRRHNVPVTKSEAKLNLEEYFASLEEEIVFYTDSYGTACLESILDLPNHLDEYKEKAIDWYSRELSIAGFSHLVGATACSLDADIYISEIRQEKAKQSNNLWLDNAVNALNTNNNTFAVLGIFDLINPDGLLEMLRIEGYEILEPR